MPSRPRSDAKARKILDAARTCLAEQGYAATTVSEIAAAAGVSRGLLHYYFDSKEDLLARVTRANLESAGDLVGGLFDSAGSAEELAGSLSAALRTLVRHDPSFFNVMVECWVVGRQSEVVAAEVDVMFRSFRDALADRLERCVARGVLAPRVPAAGLAMLLTGLLDGLALQLVIAPSLVEDDATWTAVESSMSLLLGAGA